MIGPDFDLCHRILYFIFTHLWSFVNMPVLRCSTSEHVMNREMEGDSMVSHTEMNGN